MEILLKLTVLVSTKKEVMRKWFELSPVFEGYLIYEVSIPTKSKDELAPDCIHNRFIFDYSHGVSLDFSGNTVTAGLERL